jgi:hypothetical protein
MPDGPRVVFQTDKFRVVEGANGNKTVEKFDGYDAMGGDRWRDLKFGEADAVSRLLRDWIFDHCRTCPALKEPNDGQAG